MGRKVAVVAVTAADRDIAGHRTRRRCDLPVPLKVGHAIITGRRLGHGLARAKVDSLRPDFQRCELFRDLLAVHVQLHAHAIVALGDSCSRGGQARALRIEPLVGRLRPLRMHDGTPLIDDLDPDLGTAGLKDAAADVAQRSHENDAAARGPCT